MKLRRWALSTALAQVAGIFVALAPAGPATAASLPPSEWVIGPQRRIAVITIDGQAKPKILEQVLKTLDAKKAKASFFASGSWVAHHRKGARKIVRKGHALANRGYSKTPFTALDDAALRSSIARAADVIRSVGGTPERFLRAPDGRRDARVLRVAGSMGYRSVRWTFYQGAGVSKKIARKAVRKARAGSIINLDVWRKSHREALPSIIEGLRRRNFELKRLGALKGAHAIRWDVTLRQSSGGPEVSWLQKTLRGTSYPAGSIDGNFGYATLQAVYAFEKVHGLSRDGVVPPDQMARIAVTPRPGTPKRGPRNFVDVDISRQVLFEVRNRRVTHTIPVSSGNEEYYTVDGQTYKAHTPRGNFKIERKIAGRRESRLGVLWWPSYFVGGYAIHGSDSVPTYPASHGCVRIPRYVERKFFYRNPVGTYTFVHD